MTKDNTGERAFCMTLQTREQHIRRSKATSNICTNEALMAVAAAVYLSIVGPKGLEAIAKANIANARNLMARIDELDGFDAPVFKAYHFNEFVVRSVVRPGTEQAPGKEGHNRRIGHRTPCPAHE